MLSFWEKTQLLHYDLVVLGGGITGMFCALSYRKQNPQASIAILERGLFSSGASTKNAGCACFGSLTELMDDRQHMDENALCEIVKMRLEGLALLRETLGDKALELQQKGGHELFFEKEPQALDQMDYFNSLLKPLFNKAVFSQNNAKIKTFGFDSRRVKHLIENPFEGQINTGKMMRALRSKVNQHDISFFSNTTLTHFELESKTKRLALKLKEQEIQLTCNKLAICNNAFAKQVLPDLNLSPGRGLVILTDPIPNLKINGTFHYEEGYYYFRNIQNRVLLGGGRNLDFSTETTTSFGTNSKIKDKLISDLNQFILPNQEFSLAMEWSGIMGFGKDKMPILQSDKKNIAVGVKLGGMGIAIGSKVGEQVAAQLQD